MRSILHEIPILVIFLITATHSAALAYAQEPLQKFEVGAHLAALNLNEHKATDVGIGGRFGYNVTRHLALEAEVNLLPRDLARTPRTCTSDGSLCLRAPTIPTITDNRIHGLFGAKAGVRSDRVGIFGKIRPGFMHLTNRLEVVCITEPCPPLSSRNTSFLVDFGGVLEFYPSGPFVLRFDLGDTYIHGKGIDVVPVARGLGHNIQINAGLSWRF